MNEETKIPDKFNNYLRPYGPQLYDGWSGKCVAWGYKITSHLGEDLWAELSQYGDMECSYPNWFLITKKLTIDEAIAQYGPVTEIITGPRGGFKSVTFGETKFCQKELDPRDMEGMESLIKKGDV